MAKRKKWPWVLGAILLVLILLLGGAGMLFKEELAITGTLREIQPGQPVYLLEVEGDYHFSEFLAQGGAKSDREVSVFLSRTISKGFYRADVTPSGAGCSVLAARSANGALLWGRNFDWNNSLPVLVLCRPQEGYASVCACDFRNVSESGMNKLLSIAALYVPMDGVNEAGLCVADLEVNEGGMTDIDTEKPDLTVTTALRLVLNRAATVDEAVALLAGYDIHPSGGISHHIALADAKGNAAVLEFVNGEMRRVDSPCVTNFNLFVGDTAAGGESARQRYELLCEAHEQNGGHLTVPQMRELLEAVSQHSEAQQTQWSLVCDQESRTVRYEFPLWNVTAEFSLEELS